MKILDSLKDVYKALIAKEDIKLPDGSEIPAGSLVVKDADDGGETLNTLANVVATPGARSQPRFGGRIGGQIPGYHMVDSSTGIGYLVDPAPAPQFHPITKKAAEAPVTDDDLRIEE